MVYMADANKVTCVGSLEGILLNIGWLASSGILSWNVLGQLTLALLIAEFPFIVN